MVTCNYLKSSPKTTKHFLKKQEKEKKNMQQCFHNTFLVTVGQTNKLTNHILQPHDKKGPSKPLVGEISTSSTITLRF